jgi:hypothetical protein
MGPFEVRQRQEHHHNESRNADPPKQSLPAAFDRSRSGNNERMLGNPFCRGSRQEANDDPFGTPAAGPTSEKRLLRADNGDVLVVVSAVGARPVKDAGQTVAGFTQSLYKSQELDLL